MAQETAIKRILREKGWSYRRAARELDVTFEYLCRCANGVYKSRRLGLKILNLPSAPTAIRASRRRGL